MIWIVVLAGVALLLLLIVKILSHKRKLSACQKKKTQTQWKQIEEMSDPVRQILNADSLLDEVLKMLGFSGSLGEKLKKAGPRFSDLDAVWKAHKLRNRLAHESGSGVTDAEAEQALRAFRRGIKDLC